MLHSNFSCVSALFKEKIVLEMLNDEITEAAINDPLIMKFGESIFNKLRKQHNANYIRQRMRQLARLLLAAKTVDEKIADITTLLDPANFDTIVKCVQTMGNYDHATGTYGIVALPLKIGHNLRKCAGVLQTFGLMSANNAIIEKSQHFIQLMNNEYILVSSQAWTSAAHRKFNKPVYLPVTKDVKKLTE